MPLVKKLQGVQSDATTNVVEQLSIQFDRLRLFTLLRVVEYKMIGVFKATVKYDVELWKELVTTGGWCIHVSDDEKTMEVSNEHLVPTAD